MSEKKQIELLNHQADFLEACEKFVLLSAGIGSGKSFAGALFAIYESIKNNKINGLITANTYRQLQNATLHTLFGLCNDLGINYKYNQNKGLLWIEGAQWFVYSLEHYDNIRGIEVARFWADEMRDASADAFMVLLGRLRQGKDLKGRLTTSPSGFDYLYDYFAGGKKTNEFRLINASSHDNPYLPEGYIETLKTSYDEKVFAQEVLGEFINITAGRIYYAFNRARHVSNDVTYNPSYPIYVGMDFNRNPMTAVICQSYNDAAHIIDEIWIMSSNTNEMSELIRQRYGTGLTVIPDATGKAIKTSSAGRSDHDILRNDGFKVIANGNPFRMDRYNTVNNLFEKGRINISSKCIKLINDLEKVSYKEGTTLPDTGDALLTHISDALGYFCWYAFPILPVKTSVSMIKR